MSEKKKEIKIGLLELSSNRWKRGAARRQAAKSKKTNWDILFLEFIIKRKENSFGSQRKRQKWVHISSLSRRRGSGNVSYWFSRINFDKLILKSNTKNIDYYSRFPSLERFSDDKGWPKRSYVGKFTIKLGWQWEKWC